MYAKIMKELRQDHDIKQKEIAAYLGIDQRMYSRYETGQNAMPLELVSPLCDFYNVSADYLLGRTRKKNNKSGP